ISSFLPPAGQVDYAAANAFLDAFALSQSGQLVTSVNWGRWAELGMAEAYSGSGRSHPILGHRLVQTARETVYSARLSCESDWLLREHRFKNGAALIPGTGYLQLAAAALVNGRFEQGVDFEDVFFLAPLTVASEEKKEVQVRLHGQGAGFRFSILANEGVSKDKGWIEYATGQFSRNRKRVPAKQDVTEIRERCGSRRIHFDEQRRTRQERYFDFGRRWQSLEVLHVGEGEGLAELQLGQDFSADIETWPFHPALLDMATAAALYLIPGYEESEALYLPMSYKRTTFYRPLPARVYSHIRCHPENTTRREIALFSLTLLDSDGRVLAEIGEFAMRRMATTFDSPVPGFRSRGPASSGEAAQPPENPGMSPSEGIRAFDQILTSEMPSGVIVYRGDLPSKPARPLAASSAPKTVVANPDADIENTLAGWWEDLLGVATVGLDDDFFDLGGHSLIAVRMFSKIKKTYQRELGLSTLFEGRTIRQLANLIRTPGPSSVSEAVPSAVVAVQRQGSRPPLFVVSGVGGHVIAFDGVARYLGEDQPVFALQPQGMDSREPFLTRVEDMASYYVRGVREVQPHGPYRLAGYSFGGFVVFEMAQQLLAAGETVSLLGLLDTIEWQYLERYRNSANVRQRLAMYKLRFQRVLLSGHGLWHATNRAASVFSGKLYHLMYKLHLLAAPGIPDLKTVNRIAASEYRPAVYPGRLTIFRSVSRTLLDGEDKLLGWGGLATGGIEIQDITGNHLDMLSEPNVRILAEKLRACLDRVQESDQADVDFSHAR
ncbi:MAG: polyketide synthase dehydratase domain-containing protein, partial [Terriglobales bacterium]